MAAHDMAGEPRDLTSHPLTQLRPPVAPVRLDHVIQLVKIEFERGPPLSAKLV